MFNVVGYMNYRYFFLFLGYVLLACVYGLFLTAVPFVEQVDPSYPYILASYLYLVLLLFVILPTHDVQNLPFLLCT